MRFTISALNTEHERITVMTVTDTALPRTTLDLDALRDDQIDGVSGATSWLEAIARAMGQAMEKQLEKQLELVKPLR